MQLNEAMEYARAFSVNPHNTPEYDAVFESIFSGNDTVALEAAAGSFFQKLIHMLKSAWDKFTYAIKTFIPRLKAFYQHSEARILAKTATAQANKGPQEMWHKVKLTEEEKKTLSTEYTGDGKLVTKDIDISEEFGYLATIQTYIKKTSDQVKDALKDLNHALNHPLLPGVDASNKEELQNRLDEYSDAVNLLIQKLKTILKVINQILSQHRDPVRNAVANVRDVGHSFMNGTLFD